MTRPRIKMAMAVWVVLVMTAAAAVADPGVTGTEILIGSSLALEGHAQYLGTQTLHGAMAYIQNVNEQGGIHGRKIKLIAYNDGYDPPSCIKNTEKLINEDKVFALTCYVGTPTSVKIIPIVEMEKIPLVGLFTGAEALREPVQRYIFNIRASYYEETAGIVDHFWNDLGARKIAVFYQNDAYGKAGLKGVELALAKYNTLPVATGTYERGNPGISEGLKPIVASQAEAVVMVGVYEPCANFIRSAKWSGYNPYFHNVSFVGAKELARQLGVGRDSDGVVVTQVVPPPESAYPGVVEYREILKKYYPRDEPNFVSLEGFMNAKTLVAVLQSAGANLTREGFIKAAESLTNLDVGLPEKISYTPEDHRGFSDIFYTVIKQGKYHLVENWNEIKH
ncbi:MAG: ABC transporter substrate-binding protein [Pseudomonadota bacterium]